MSPLFLAGKNSRLPLLEPPSRLCTERRTMEQIEQDEDLERFFKVLTPVGFSAFNRSEGRILRDQEVSPKLRSRLETMVRFYRRTNVAQGGQIDLNTTAVESEAEPGTEEEAEWENKEDTKQVDEGYLADDELSTQNQGRRCWVAARMCDADGDLGEFPASADFAEDELSTQNQGRGCWAAARLCGANRDLGDFPARISSQRWQTRTCAAKHLQEAREMIQREIADREFQYWSQRLRSTKRDEENIDW
jgi:hypothetical protein